MANCREYGNPPYSAIVVHGGPGAPGCCAGICRGLSDEFGVLEHLQEGHTIRELIDEIRDIILRYDLQKTILIGHSWGAWLAFLFAAQYPQHVNKVILVGCGPFDVKYYPQLVAARSVKIMPIEQREDIQAANLYSPNMEYNPDNYCHIPNLPKDMIAFNEAQFNSLMGEVMPMRESGELLDSADAIRCPVVAIHGKHDPHVVDGVRVPSGRRLADFKMYVLDKCGHDPWREHYAKDRFFALLKEELVI